MYHIYMGALKVKDTKGRAEYLGLKLLFMQDTAAVRATFLPVLYGRSSPPLKWFPLLFCFALISTKLGLT